MLYRSLTDPSIQRGFAAAVVEGIAPDKGLYFPERIPQLSEDHWLAEEDLEPWQLGARMMHPFMPDWGAVEELEGCGPQWNHSAPQCGRGAHTSSGN